MLLNYNLVSHIGFTTLAKRKQMTILSAIMYELILTQGIYNNMLSIHLILFSYVDSVGSFNTN